MKEEEDLHVPVRVDYLRFDRLTPLPQLGCDPEQEQDSRDQSCPAQPRWRRLVECRSGVCVHGSIGIERRFGDELVGFLFSLFFPRVADGRVGAVV